MKPSNACSGAFVLGPLISSDNIFICLSKPSKTIINLLGVDNEKLFFDLIDFSKKSIKSKKSFSLSTPNRLIIVFEGLDKQIKILSEEIKGPNINAPEQALEGFMRSNKIEKKDLFKNKTEKGEFYFYKTKSKLLKINDLLTEFIPKLLENYQWKRSMKWGEYDLNWGRPLKSILSVFDKTIINFQFHHLSSSNSTYIDKDFEEKKKFLKILNHMKIISKNKELLLIRIKEKK